MDRLGLLGHRVFPDLKAKQDPLVRQVPSGRQDLQDQQDHWGRPDHKVIQGQLGQVELLDRTVHQGHQDLKAPLVFRVLPDHLGLKAELETRDSRDRQDRWVPLDPLERWVTQACRDRSARREDKGREEIQGHRGLRVHLDRLEAVARPVLEAHLALRDSLGLLDQQDRQGQPVRWATPGQQVYPVRQEGPDLRVLLERQDLRGRRARQGASACQETQDQRALRDQQGQVAQQGRLDLRALQVNRAPPDWEDFQEIRVNREVQDQLVLQDRLVQLVVRGLRELLEIQVYKAHWVLPAHQGH